VLNPSEHSSRLLRLLSSASNSKPKVASLDEVFSQALRIWWLSQWTLPKRPTICIYLSVKLLTHWSVFAKERFAWLSDNGNFLFSFNFVTFLFPSCHAVFWPCKIPVVTSMEFRS
jgi:hypothetical protein